MLEVSDFVIPGANAMTLGAELAASIKERFSKDRDNRFQIYTTAAGLRKQHLDPTTKAYSNEFVAWYDRNGMKKLFGEMSASFSRYAAAGELVDWVATYQDLSAVNQTFAKRVIFISAPETSHPASAMMLFSSLGKNGSFLPIFDAKTVDTSMPPDITLEVYKRITGGSDEGRNLRPSFQRIPRLRDAVAGVAGTGRSVGLRSRRNLRRENQRDQKDRRSPRVEAPDEGRTVAQISKGAGLVS